MAKKKRKEPPSPEVLEERRLARIYRGLVRRVATACRDDGLRSVEQQLLFLRSNGSKTKLPSELGLNDTIRAFEDGIKSFTEDAIIAQNARR